MRSNFSQADDVERMSGETNGMLGKRGVAVGSSKDAVMIAQNESFVRQRANDTKIMSLTELSRIKTSEISIIFREKELPFIANDQVQQGALMKELKVAKQELKNCRVDLGRDTRTSTQLRRLVRRKDVSWSLNWPSGAN